ncbi:MAG: hypothetical protein IJC29_04030 [Clostridia bacterium]|nr:hypothetical protein [Clostridia bacterium]
MNNHVETLKNESKYRTARLMLLLIVILSAVNVFAIALETRFLFSSYFTQLLAEIGLVLYAETGEIVLYIVFAVIALISVVPYLVCWIFSGKKRAGWMIAALVLFSLDSVFFLIDYVFLFTSEQYVFLISYTADLVIRAVALWYLAWGVKHGFSARWAAQNAQGAQQQENPAYMTADAPVQGEAQDAAAASVTRQITVTRQKSFAGAALRLICQLDGVQVAALKLGETATFSADGASHELLIFAGKGGSVEGVTIPAGTQNRSYVAKIKMGMLAGSVVIEEVSPNAIV